MIDWTIKPGGSDMPPTGTTWPGLISATLLGMFLDSGDML